MLNGSRWANTPTSGCCATIHVQILTGLFGSSRTAYNGAISAWTNSAANVILTSASGALTAGDTVNSSVTWDGLTSYATHACGSKTCFTYAHSLLNFWFTQNYTSDDIQGVAAHELGHAIGLAHQPTGCALMRASTQTRCGLTGPAADDVNGANHIY